VIRTTVVGSYPVPAWLRAFPNAEHLRDAMAVVVKAQELAGIEVVADGELGRFDVGHPDTNGMIDHFVRPLDGVETALTLQQVDAWRAKKGMGYRSRPAGVVTGPISGGTLDLRSEWELFRPLATLPKKFTVTSPYMLAKVLADDHYGDLGALVLALADVLAEQLRGIDADVVQVDEANVTGSPEDAALCAEGINRLLAAASGEKAVHLCFGNYGGQTVQRGTYDALVGFLDALHADHVVLEVARRPEAELAALAATDPKLGLGIGVIDIKDNEVETADEVARRIEVAAKVAGPDRIVAIHPDCGLWMLQRSVADAKLRALAAGRDLYEGR
jgi:5-methyltetrahydropteroyltriglutamate--homocysteine methyltransferase